MAELALAGHAGATSRPRSGALALMFVSGFASLAYEIVWTQQSAVWLGHESMAVLAVVGAFFAGLAVGAWWLGRKVAASPRPALWYAGCELAIGVWALMMATVVDAAGPLLLTLTGERPGAVWQWTVAFAGTFVLLLPATAAMGATLPALERLMASRAAGGGALAALYGSNTAGAVLGVLATAFWLLPEFGLTRTVLGCALLNLLCAIAARMLYREAVPPRVRSVPPASSLPDLVPRLVLTGLLGIGYEVLVVRVLRQVSENTVYTFAMLLAVYLLGTAAGAAAYQQACAQRMPKARAGDVLLLSLGVACLIGTGSLWMAGSFKGAVLHVLGPGLAAALAAEAVLAVIAFLLPTVLMGALFSHLCMQAADRPLGVGGALAFNTLGAAVAPVVFGLVLAPALGSKNALLLIAAGYVVLAWRGAGMALPAAAATAATLASAALAPPLVHVDVPEGGRIVSHREGAMGSVSVVEDVHGVARLHIDNRQQEGSSSTLYADARQALLPMLLHSAPRHALFLGYGTGMTATFAAQEAGLQVDAVELVPEVIDVSSRFTQALLDQGAAALPTVIAADARRYVRASARRYDLIVSDNFHPARSGSASLYTVEHFRAVHERLAPGGVFCQWLPLHQLDVPTLRSIVRSFMAVEPGGFAVLATYSLETPVLGLVAREGGGPFDPAALRTRLRDIALSVPPSDFGIGDELALLGSVVAGPQALARIAGDAALNTDDRPIVAYRAPRITYVPDSLPRERLLALLDEFAVAPGEVERSGDAEWTARLAAYRRARDHFLRAGRHVQPSIDVRRMLAQVREPLLQALRISPDFQPAYDPLLQMAVAIGRNDPATARALLSDLVRLQPARSDAREELARIDEARP